MPDGLTVASTPGGTGIWTVGLVLVEAVVLYVGYGTATRAVHSVVHDWLMCD